MERTHRHNYERIRALCLLWRAYPVNFLKFREIVKDARRVVSIETACRNSFLHLDLEGSLGLNSGHSILRNNVRPQWCALTLALHKNSKTMQVYFRTVLSFLHKSWRVIKQIADHFSKARFGSSIQVPDYFLRCRVQSRFPNQPTNQDRSGWQLYV